MKGRTRWLRDWDACASVNRKRLYWSNTQRPTAKYSVLVATVDNCLTIATILALIVAVKESPWSLLVPFPILHILCQLHRIFIKNNNGTGHNIGMSDRCIAGVCYGSWQFSKGHVPLRRTVISLSTLSITSLHRSVGNQGSDSRRGRLSLAANLTWLREFFTFRALLTCS